MIPSCTVRFLVCREDLGKVLLRKSVVSDRLQRLLHSPSCSSECGGSLPWAEGQDRLAAPWPEALVAVPIVPCQRPSAAVGAALLLASPSGGGV